MNIENLFKGEGGYVFVSHSHLDIHDVRKIRNHLEKEGMEPILFYLRCMDTNDEEKKEALKKLIYDEIDAREFFLYVDSENAAASTWVQDELEHIHATRPHCLVSVDLRENDATTQEKLSRLVRGMRIFIAASHRDIELVRRLKTALSARDFRVYDVATELSAGDAWDMCVHRTIAELAQEGFVLALITEASVRSNCFRDELKAAISEGVPILPVVVGDAPLFLFMDEFPSLRTIQLGILSEQPTDEEITTIVRDAIMMQKQLF